MSTTSITTSPPSKSAPVCIYPRPKHRKVVQHQPSVSTARARVLSGSWVSLPAVWPPIVPFAKRLAIDHCGNCTPVCITEVWCPSAEYRKAWLPQRQQELEGAFGSIQTDRLVSTVVQCLQCHSRARAPDSTAHIQEQQVRVRSQALLYPAAENVLGASGDQRTRRRRPSVFFLLLGLPFSNSLFSHRFPPLF
jgi:hypothetical protein